MPRLSMGALLLVVALLALTMAAFRVHFSLGWFVGCVEVLGFKRTFDSLALGRAMPDNLPPRISSSILIRSMGLAAFLLGLSILAGFCAFAFSLLLGSKPVRIRGWDLTLVPTECLLVLFPVAVLTASQLRKRFWTVPATDKSCQQPQAPGSEERNSSAEPSESRPFERKSRK